MEKLWRQWMVLEPRLALAQDGGAVVSWSQECQSDLLRVSHRGVEVWRRKTRTTPCLNDLAVPRDITFLKDGSLLSAGWLRGAFLTSAGRVVDGDVQDIYLLRLAP